MSSDPQVPPVEDQETLLRFVDPAYVKQNKVHWRAYFPTKWPLRWSVYREGRTDLGQLDRARTHPLVEFNAGEVRRIPDVDGVLPDENPPHAQGHANIHVLGRLDAGNPSHLNDIGAHRAEVREICERLAEVAGRVRPVVGE